MFITFMTSGQYHFLPQITGLRSNKARSSKSTQPIPRLYAAITTGWVMFFLLFTLIHLLAFPTGSTPYALLPMVTIKLSFHRIISRLLVLLKSYDPFLFSSYHYLLPMDIFQSNCSLWYQRL